LSGQGDIVTGVFNIILELGLLAASAVISGGLVLGERVEVSADGFLAGDVWNGMGWQTVRL